MPRHHTIWDASQKKQIDVPFTDEEEVARDAVEAAWDAAANERAFAVLRQERNTLLEASDWRGVSDLTMSDAWKTYRQTLRDLPANTADPNNVTWPEEPS